MYVLLKFDLSAFSFLRKEEAVSHALHGDYIIPQGSWVHNLKLLERSPANSWFAIDKDGDFWLAGTGNDPEQIKQDFMVRPPCGFKTDWRFLPRERLVHLISTAPHT